MNLLIVDDQPNVIAALLQKIPWQGLEIFNVYTAASALAAREILQNKKVDILMTDIEMPRENGLSLIRWVRSSNLDTECILLTSHANFFYAQTAISLEVSNYVIQPASNDDIIQAIEQAKLRLSKKRNTTEKLRANAFLSSVQNTVIRQFFDSLPAEPKKDPRVLQQLEELGVTPDKLDTLTAIYFRLHRWRKLPPPFSEFFRVFQDMLKKSFVDLRSTLLCYYKDQSAIYAVLFSPAPDDIESRLRLFQQDMLQVSGCVMSTFFSATHLETMENAFSDARACAERIEAEGVVLEVPQDSQPYQSSPSHNYEKYMDKLKKYVQQHLDEPLTRDGLAHELCISPDHLSSVVHFVTGHSLKTFITQKRMRRGRELLLTTDLTIGEISAACGYESAAYFSKVYRDTYHTTPREERKRS